MDDGVVRPLDCRSADSAIADTMNSSRLAWELHVHLPRLFRLLRLQRGSLLLVAIPVFCRRSF